MGIPYEATTINIFKNTQFEDWYVKINPNSKIPSIVDPKGPGKTRPCARTLFLPFEKRGGW
jgi:glutathione S-transferase